MNQNIANQTNNKTIRAHARSQRKQLSDTNQTLASERLLLTISQDPFFKQAKHIACYQAFDGELNVAPIIEHIWSEGNYCYLPSVQSNTKALSFHLFTDQDALSDGAFSISESRNTEVPLTRLDLVLMPLVAFDKNGNRLGMGGGYYDYTFRDFKDTQTRGAKLYGLAHACQEVDHIHVQEWDIKPDKIIAV